MDALKRLLATSELKTTKFAQNLKKGRIYHTYDDVFDALILLVVPPDTQTVVHYVDKHIGILYEPVSKEIVGLQIESFKKSFLQEHAELQKVWKMTEAIPQFSDYGELTVKIEAQKPAITREILKVSQSVIRREIPQFNIPVYA